MSKLKVMTMGDSLYASTGYGQLWNNLVTKWKKKRPDWEFSHLSWQSTDREHKNEEGIVILPRGTCNYGSDILPAHLINHNPDVLITLGDVGIIRLFVAGVKKAKQMGWKGEWISAVNVDSHTWEGLEWNDTLSYPNHNLGLSEWTSVMLQDFGVKNVSTIPHGVDTEVYKPSEDKEKLRLAYGVSNKFSVGFVGKNQRRKQIPQLINGFSKFSKDKDDVMLILHTDENPAPGGYGWFIDTLVEKYSHNDKELPKKIRFLYPKTDVLKRQFITPEDMAKYYNILDVFCYPTGGEGFGLPAIESQACGVPLIMSAYTTGFELTEDHGFRIPVLQDKYGRLVTEVGTNGIENCVPDDNEVARLLEETYQLWKKGELKAYGEKAREFSLRYDWDIISDKFLELIEKVDEDNRPNSQ